MHCLAKIHYECCAARDCEIRYSLVGEVVSVGRELELGDWKGRRFFSFSPHGTAAVIDAESAMEVGQRCDCTIFNYRISFRCWRPPNIEITVYDGI